jgi:DNA (cytosine-5)-methyltransferase 1
MFPTPTVHGNYNRKGASKNSGDGLATFVAKYPTPRTTGLYGGTGSRKMIQKLFNNNQITETERTSMINGNGGTLNPTWVEWLMGFPLGYTNLADSATPKSPSWQQWLLNFCIEE